MVGFLLSILIQLAFQDEVIFDGVHQACLSSDQPKLRSETILRELAAKAITTQRTCFLVIDGLDECSGTTEHSPREVQTEILDWLLDLSKTGGVIDRPDSRSLRILLVGQRNGVLEESLRDFPEIRLEDIADHSADISAYCEQKSTEIQAKFSFDDQVRAGLVAKVRNGAKGRSISTKLTLIRQGRG